MLSNAGSEQNLPNSSFGNYQSLQSSNIKTNYKSCKRIKKNPSNTKETNLHSKYSEHLTTSDKQLSSYCSSNAMVTKVKSDKNTKKPSASKTKKIMSDTLHKKEKHTPSSYYSTDGTLPQVTESGVSKSISPRTELKSVKSKAQKKIDQKIVATRSDRLTKKIIRSEKKIKVTTAPGTQLSDKVKLKKELGAGQFNTVHAAERGKTNTFAVKCMKMNYVPKNIIVKPNENSFERNHRMMEQFTERTREAMIHEGKIAKEICRRKEELPFVMPIYEVRILKGKDEGACIVTSKLCSKGDLQKYSESELKNKPKEQAQILVEIFKGQKNLHDVGIVHRDIKLSNMLLTKEGTALVGDIGHAYKIDENIPHLPVTNFSILPPTNNFKLLSDELKPREPAPAQGVYNYLQDPKNDSFAFGILMCNLLRNAEGRGAFNADNRDETMATLSWLKLNKQTDLPKCEGRIAKFIEETPFHHEKQKELVKKLLSVNPDDIPSDSEILATLETIFRELTPGEHETESTDFPKKA